MDNKINELKKNLPKESCSFCTHLSLDGPDENLKYNVIIANTLNQNIVV